jgi:hypothetical protein
MYRTGNNSKYPERVKGLVLHGAWDRMPLSTIIMTKILLKLPGSKKRETKRAEILFQQKYPLTPESFFRQLYTGLYFDDRKLLGQIKEGTVEDFLAERRFSQIHNVTSEDYKKMYFHGVNADRSVCSLLYFAHAVIQ